MEAEGQRKTSVGAGKHQMLPIILCIKNDR